jgi:beta-1,4-mannosyl-glycoprotein beta-1,4-N-acetylglucosaminyltransferase
MGNSKPLYYLENRDKFTKFNHKIIHVIVDDFIENPSKSIPHDHEKIDHNLPLFYQTEVWKNEYHQRNCIHCGIQRIELELSNSDYVMISDVDEIPDPDTLVEIRKSNISYGTLEQDMYYYNLLNRKESKWTLAKIVRFDIYRTLLNSKPQNCRIYYSDKDIIKKGGWHMSYFGTINDIQNKIREFSHQEFNTDINVDTEVLRRRIDQGTDVFDRKNEKLIYVPIRENEYLPNRYSDFFEEGGYLKEI